MKILDFAIAVELAERDLYQRLANCTRDVGIRSIFRMIADDEGKLLKKLRELKQDPEKRSIELHAPPVAQRAVRKAQSGNCELLDQQYIRDDLSSYSYIMRTEQLLVNLYSNLQEREHDPEAKALIKMILQEKQAEIERVHMIYSFVNAPNEYLAWREFSNLGEFHNFDHDKD